ncbi:condensation domain-containing protein [Williamsia soli]|uniref:condensation domain-containing protein n=1 Tax=Williamsia soli TaxID=364929 RepID=UPI001A9FEBE0|nr:condensation domain-containing protein [Williamsia soli]
MTKTVDAQGRTHLARLTSSGEVLEVAPHSVGRLGNGAHVRAHLVDLFDTQISPLTWPHCLVATISDADAPIAGNGFLVVFGADHSVMDAYSMLLAISEIQRLYAYELHGIDPALSEIGSHVDFSANDRIIGGGLTAEHHAVEKWQRFLDAGDGQFPRFGLPVKPEGINPHAGRQQNGMSTWLLSTEEVNRVNANCRELGHNMQSAVLASLALAQRELVGESTLRFVMPMHTRHESQYVESVGWYVGIIPVEVDITAAETFGDCMGASAEAVAATKSFARYPYPRIAQLLGRHAVPQFVVSYLDVRFVPGAAEWERWRARTLRSGTFSDDEVYLWIARTPVGMTVSARFPATEVADTGVRRFIDALGELLLGFARDGDHPTAGRSPTSLTIHYSQDKFPA